MPLYGSNPWLDLASGTAGMHNSMANIALAQRQAQYRMQQDAAKMALEQQQLQLEREKAEHQYKVGDSDIKRNEAMARNYGFEGDMARQTMDTQQRIGRLRGYEGSPDIMSMIQDPFSGPQMMGDLRAANVVPQGQFQLTPEQIMQALHAATGAQTYQQGMSTAAAAQRATEPYTVNPNQNLVDPFSRQSLYAAPPASISPYQRGRLDIDQLRADELARHNLQQESARRREVAGRIVGELGRAFQTGDLMEGARNELADSMGIPYNQQQQQTKRPTRAMAQEYVKKYGKKAKDQLASEGYDITGYAD